MPLRMGLGLVGRLAVHAWGCLLRSWLVVHAVCRPCVRPTHPLCLQALRALRSAQATLEGLPAELLGRVNQSGRWSFKQMLQQQEGERVSSPPAAGGTNGGASRRLPASGGAQQQQQLSAAQKAAMSAVSLLSGGIAAHRSPTPR